MYELAYQLKMPYHMVCSMPYDEVQGWFAYFEERPPGWRDDSRAFVVATAASQGGLKKNPEELFDSLKTLKAAAARRRALIPPEQLVQANLRTSGFLGFLLNKAAENGVPLGVRTGSSADQEAVDAKTTNTQSESGPVGSA